MEKYLAVVGTVWKPLYCTSEEEDGKDEGEDEHEGVARAAAATTTSEHNNKILTWRLKC